MAKKKSELVKYESDMVLERKKLDAAKQARQLAKERSIAFIEDIQNLHRGPTFEKLITKHSEAVNVLSRIRVNSENLDGVSKIVSRLSSAADSLIGGVADSGKNAPVQTNFQVAVLVGHRQPNQQGPEVSSPAAE